MTDEFFIIKSQETLFNGIEQRWMEILHQQLKEVVYHGISFTRIAFISIYGSQNYHLAGPRSDIDSECFIFPAMDDLCFAKTPTSFKISTEYGDIYVKDIRLMFDELRKCSPNILELLASNYIWINKEYQYYILSILKNVDTFAKLNTYKLLKGLEGLVKRYCTPSTVSPKFIVNAARIKQMIQRIINEENFSSTLIPENAVVLFNNKYRNSEPDDLLKLTTIKIECNEILSNYFNTHNSIFQPKIKELIDESQRALLMHYIHSI